MAETTIYGYDTSDQRALDRQMRSFLLSQKILEGIKARQLSRFSFAALMDVQPSIITRWLSGKHNFTIETLFQIEDCLGIKLLAIETPALNSVNLHLRVNSNQAVFNQEKAFPGFTSINLREDQTVSSDVKSQDWESYLLQLRTDLENNDR